MFGVLLDGGASKKVTGYSGGGVLIKCKYHTEYTPNPKYFCKGSSPGCSDQIKTGNKNEWVNSGRFSLFDDTKSAEFRVMIRELTVQDTGTYYCGVDIPTWTDIYTAVELKVKEDLSYEKSISKTVHVGGDLNISFKYPESLRSDPKFLCKSRLQQAACFYNESVKESRKFVNEGKFSLYDDGAKQIFTVSIRNVTEQDSGEYWCGAEGAGTSDHGYKVYFTQINLKATDSRVPVSTLKPKQPSSPSSSSSSSSSPPPSSSSPPSVSLPGFPASTVIPVFIILLLFLIGISFVFVIVQRRHKMRVAVCEYEEIKDTGRLSASNAGTFTDFSSAQLPTISSDPQSIYTNTEIPTSPCDSLVYSTVQLPTIPCDQDIYSTVQLPTCVSAEKSPESLNCATVRFHTKATSSNDGVPPIIFKKEELSRDSASVNHVTSCG
ncbi:polymeric immunoglobulin receptor-like [Neoarius graeffei]|uniref:polymeric immunoglobulin receptor-like n=1 Tax=Neoarius graeffei TaxID=443677 RepID=UPI00298D2C0B|nr:polymeric immunoglobulin receptor-like [Neoarius graeffei]